MSELIDIVDENDKVIGQDTRASAHQKGLLHREIWLWLYNDKKEILFQLRSQTKDRYPGLLGASVAGHVSTGEDYEQTLTKEIKEELGLTIAKNDLQYLDKIRTKTFDKLTGTYNNTFKKVFVYKFSGKAEDLKSEPGESDGFEFWPLEKIINPKEEYKKLFVPTTWEKPLQAIFKKIKMMLYKTKN